MQNPPRCGYWLASKLRLRSKSVLEIAGGSCRDSRYLSSRRGIGRVVATDFEETTLLSLRNRFPCSSLQLQTEDAFNLSFQSKSFDVSFHNGFFVLFDDDDTIRRLLHEQARVTRGHIAFLVHNIENQTLVNDFKERSCRDKLYDIRFFHRAGVERLVRESGIPIRSLQILKFGGESDRWLRRNIGRLPNPLFPVAPHLVPYMYDSQPWEQTERIACLVALA